MGRPSTPALLVVITLMTASAQTPRIEQSRQNPEFEALQAHFEKVVARRHEQLFAGISNRSQWEPHRREIQNNLKKMLWHNLAWPKTSPAATITNRTEHKDYIIENLILETAPKLFLTANLYLPRTGQKKFPVILYQCGHTNKSYFGTHGAWFASQGIAVLVMDNIEMGELEFTHHGVYSNAWFHWYSRGFSPLAVELWNARRAVDYLAVRPDLDAARIGATGRSGGGTATFFLAAVDDRIAASAPVSAPISTNAWVRQRLTFAHCDCQFPVNSYGMLYAEVGALVAPRPQLLANADADAGFPMNAFTELVDKMREAYRFYSAEDALRISVTPGGHVDTEVIRLPVYSFFLREFLGRKEPVTGEGPLELPAPDEFACFRKGLPLDERLTRIDEEMIPLHGNAPSLARPELIALLKREVFRYFPSQPEPLAVEWSEPVTRRGRTIRSASFTSFEGLRVKARYSLPAAMPAGTRLPVLLIADDRRGIPVWGNEQPLEENQWDDRAVLIVETLDRGSRVLERNLRSFSDNDPLHHMKRQTMIVGTTLESMQVYELLRSIDLLRSLPEVDPARITIFGKGEMGVNGLYAALLDGNVQRIVMASPPASHRQGPHYLGILRYTDIPQVAALLADRVRIQGEVPAALGTVARCGSLPGCLKK